MAGPSLRFRLVIARSLVSHFICIFDKIFLFSQNSADPDSCEVIYFSCSRKKIFNHKVSVSALSAARLYCLILSDFVSQILEWKYLPPPSNLYSTIQQIVETGNQPWLTHNIVEPWEIISQLKQIFSRCCSPGQAQAGRCPSLGPSLSFLCPSEGTDWQQSGHSKTGLCLLISILCWAGLLGPVILLLIFNIDSK